MIANSHGTEAVSIQPASGRSGIGFSTQRAAPAPGQSPHLYVIPADALPLITGGKVDRRLFDVTLLLEFQYDDAHRDDLPLIVTYGPAIQQQRGGAQQLGASPRGLNGAVQGKRLLSVHGMSAKAPKARAEEVWRDIAAARAPVGAQSLAAAGASFEKVWLDALLQPVLDYSVPQIGAPAAWDRGYEGDGVLVAVLDTGVDTTHPDLATSVIDSRNFTFEDDLDLVGHGTHVASIIAGSGAASNGDYRGVAPGAQLLSGKVCEVFGCLESSIIAGMEWAAIEEGAQVVNLSLGGTDLPGLDPLEEAVNRLTDEYGTLFVIAAGNAGPGTATVSSPGSAERALTVGAVDRDDNVAFFSGRGMTPGDSVLKPDIAAPGVDIVAARAAGTELGTPVGASYMTLSGTSMATPHVVGAAALLLQQHPDWGPVEAKSALMGSATYGADWTVLEQGAGRVDVANALDTSVIVETPSVGFGLAPWPHDDDEPVTRTVSFRNLGSATELVFDLDVVGPGGIRPPAGMFTVTPSALVLPQGATASVTVTADTSIETPDGVYAGRLIAVDDASRSLTVPIAANREEESYSLTVQHFDRSGAPTMQWAGFIVGLDRSMFDFLSAGPLGGDVTLRLPRGRYALESVIFEGGFGEPLTRLVAANQQLTSDTLLVMDAGLSQPIGAQSPKPEAENLLVGETWSVQTECCGIVSSFSAGAIGDVAFYHGEVGPAAPDLHSFLAAQWLDGASTPVEVYSGAWFAQGSLPKGPVKEMDLRKAAVVHERYAAPMPAPGTVELSNAAIGVGVYGGDAFGGASASLFSATLPQERTEYYYSDSKEARWWKTMLVFSDDFSNFASLDGGFSHYRAHQTYTSAWSQAPFSPLWPEPTSWLATALRQGDRLLLNWPMYGDRAGHASYVATEGHTRLYANGELIGESASSAGGAFEVPPESAEYRMELSYSQSTFELTPHQEVVWTFESAHVDDSEPERLPLLTLQFNPDLNELGEAPRGRFRLPLSVMQYGRKHARGVKRPVVQVSYDEGASWASAEVDTCGKHWEVLLDHPSDTDYVSLRASAQDRHGNGVEQTLIRAYALSGCHAPEGGSSD